MNKKYRDNMPEIHVLESPILSIAGLDFTDNTDDTGYADITAVLPAGAIPIGWKAQTVTAFSSSVAFSGDPTTLAFVDGGVSDDTITDSASGFVTDGFEVGDLITVAGATTAANDFTIELTAVAAGTLTFATATVDTAEDGIANMTIVATVAAAIQVGVAGDVDRFSAQTTGSVGTVGTVGAACIAADACDGINADQTVRVTITETADFTDYTAGAVIVSLYYIKTAI
jgi:hypothetical protein